MFVKDQAVHIVSEIGEADLGFGASQADGADHQAEAGLFEIGLRAEVERKGVGRRISW